MAASFAFAAFLTPVFLVIRKSGESSTRIPLQLDPMAESPLWEGFLVGDQASIMRGCAIAVTYDAKSL